MSIGKEFLKELLLESKVTRKYLELVPFDQQDFKPAEKSETLGRLAVHVAEIFNWWISCVQTERLDFEHFEPHVVNSTEELLAYFDALLLEASQALESVADDEWSKKWSMTYGDELLFSLPKLQVARVFCMNHLVHHRAQLGVYLRILNVSIPATYGPSADDEQVILIQAM